MKEDIRPSMARTHMEQSSLMSLVSGWFQQGFENFISTQRILVELAMRQNANAINVIQKRMSDKEVCPVAIMSEFAGEGIANIIEAQKVLLELAQRENELIMNGVKERVGISSIFSAMTDFFRRSVDNFLEMHHGFLKIASKQTQHWLDATRTGKGYDPAILVSVAQEGEGIATTVYATEPLGGETIVDLALGHQVIKAIAPPTVELEPDAKVLIRLDPQRIHLFDGAGDAVMSAAGAAGVFGVSFV